MARDRYSILLLLLALYIYIMNKIAQLCWGWTKKRFYYNAYNTNTQQYHLIYNDYFYFIFILGPKIVYIY